MSEIRFYLNPRFILGWRWLVFGLALVPWALWVGQVMQGQAGPEPGRYLLLNLGHGALWCLLLTLSLTPLTRLTGWKGFRVIRRQLGLWSLAYALMHLLCYVLFILGLEWSQLGKELVERPYIIVGALALTGLVVLGITSNRWAMQRLGRRWKPLHKSVYVILMLVMLHFLWVVRADLSTWSAYALVAAGLMLLRWPPLARRLSRRPRRMASS
ncbi:sulfoxide reductase heme-binding subunit YedZ [Terasakiispira papahanaumokuakeensis]|uniref:Protein-methionine-sulfoxide reductase heme-binding subunit MsrQ n=1 Tax=Terasakiispira papahanaumokuakeensis TaxID=197479 RepID=A0A1E2V7V8_9GAMM|nr:protein-methionine-sulfoxide reductase heme-binding subunit MsrQ [Terasakiispira papahanaumokuakeensis]ODC03100.1 sulfoxide reductase heme-binding subunit YedZ [Terasakiispira papahanaumokuakeensis]